MLNGHGGNILALAHRLGCRPEEIIDVSSNINPLGPPPGLMRYLRGQMAVLCRLPEVDGREVSTRMATLLGVNPDRILAGAGTTPFIHDMFAVLRSRRVVIVGPTYADYADACRRHGIAPEFFLAEARLRFWVDGSRLDETAGRADTVVICNPNNPTGAMISREELLVLCRRHPATRFVIDESYLPFVADAEHRSLIHSGLENVIVLHSLSKVYRLPGLRIGFVIAAASIIELFRQRLLPWSLNSLAQAAIMYLTENMESVATFVRKSRGFIGQERARFYSRLRDAPAFKAFPSNANFFLIELPFTMSAARVWDRLAQKRVLVRDCSNFYGLNERFIRIAIHQSEVNAQVADMLLACAGRCDG